MVRYPGVILLLKEGIQAFGKPGFVAETSLFWQVSHGPEAKINILSHATP